MTTSVFRVRLLATLAAILTLCLSTAPRLAAQGAWSPHYDMPGFGIGGRVFGLGTWRNELIACTYSTPWRDGNALNHVARFDGVRWYALGSGTNGKVRTAVEFQGDLYVGGLFTYAGGAPATDIARWDGAQWHAVGAGLSGEVWTLCVHQGELYAGGDFVQSGAQSVPCLARWTGSQWVAVGGGLQWLLGVNTACRALLSDGTDLYVGGEFDRAGGLPASHVARWDGATWHALGGGINNFGYALIRALVKHNGRIYIGGAFGQAGAVAADNIAAWDGSTWTAVGAGVQGTTYGAVVEALCVFNNELHVGGHFTSSGANTSFFNVARFDGSLLQPIGGVALAEVNPPTVIAMVAWNHRLYCGGEFEVAGRPFVAGQTIGVYHIASYDGSSWSHVGDGLGFGGEVHVLGRYQGDVIAGGHFTIAGTSYAPGLARFDGTQWRHFGRFDGDVDGMVEHLGDLWVAGEFHTVNGITANGVARWDGSQWSAVGGGPSLYGASCIASYQGMIHIGTIGSPLRWNGTTWETFTPPIYGALTAMHVHQGVLYFGGSTPFHPGAPNLFAWDGAVLSVPGGGLDDMVEGLGSFNNELIVGGRFTMAGGVPARSIARWNGSSWSTFGTGIQGATVKAITTFGGSLVIGGDFSQFQGAAADYVARWTGSGWAPLAAAQPNGTIFALLADDARGELYAGGWYSRIGTNDAGYFGVFENTPFWTDTGASLASPRRAPRLSGDGRLLAGSSARWRLSSAQESSLGVLAMGTSSVNVPVFGGVLVPSPDVLALLVTDDIGTAAVTLPWPGPLPGFQAWAQAWLLDANGPQGFTASNGVWLRAP
ncbi:MAG TPA: hypothetical protein VFZ65_08140 [Planctomycetota bacterium]|nr:hypothetical protein [Planctomycetota bacterium]